jgi:formylglycine-generating enzyme required for sulfatase activity
LGTDENAARKVVVLFRRAAGMTNVPGGPDGTPTQVNNLGGAVAQNGSSLEPTSTETIEVVNLDASGKPVGQNAATAAEAGASQEPGVQPPKEGQTFTNRLGMIFVPVPRHTCLIGTWETRVADFEQFARATDYKSHSLDNSHTKGGLTDKDWQNPGFQQTGQNPVVGVNVEDAKAFAAWLTQSETAAGRLKAGQTYRLPTEAEWWAACAEETNIENLWPPSKNYANFAGTEVDASLLHGVPAYFVPIAGYHDDYPFTAPGGTFRANAIGVYDLFGNAAQIVMSKKPDWIGDAEASRGGSWLAASKEDFWLRAIDFKHARSDDKGFRLVLDFAGNPDWSEVNTSVTVSTSRRLTP